MTETVHRGVYVSGMDGLRAIACLAVFGVHWQQMTGIAFQWKSFDFARLLENGNTGVAVFMILSGFLLALPIFASSLEDRNRFSLREYFRRRAARILPAYYICLTALIVVTGHWQSVRQLLDVLLHVTFLHNLTSWTLHSINPPLWALAPIVQFYGFFAVVILLLRRLGQLSDVAILITFTGIVAISQIIVTSLTLAEPTAASSAAWVGKDAVCLMHSLPSHACIFGLGILVAWAHVKLPNAPTLASDTVVILSSILCFAILATSLDDRLQIPGGRYNFPFVPLLLAAIVLSIPRSGFSKRLLETPLIKRLGIVSYAFYLFHLPIMKAAKGLTQSFDLSVTEHPYLFAIASIVMTVVASELVFQVIERPLAHRIRL